MAKSKLARVGIDHPDVCQSSTGSRACEYAKVPGSQFCAMHKGHATSGKTQALKTYKIELANRQRVEDIAGSAAVKSLADEVALTRFVLELLMNEIKVPGDAMLYSDKIIKMTDGIAKLLVVMQSLQEKNRELVTKETVIKITDELIQVVIDNVEDADAIQRIADAGGDILSKHLEL